MRLVKAISVVNVLMLSGRTASVSGRVAAAVAVVEFWSKGRIL